MSQDHHFSKSAVISTWIHWLNLERLNLERFNLERLNLEWTEPRMDWTSNGLNHKWTQPQMDWTPNGTEPRMGLNLEWNQPRMGLKPEWDWTPNILNPKWTQPRHFPLNPFKNRAARGWVWTQEWYSTLTFLSIPRIWCTMCQGKKNSIYQKNGFKNKKCSLLQQLKWSRLRLIGIHRLSPIHIFIFT
jgi:hypothetical protein